MYRQRTLALSQLLWFIPALLLLAVLILHLSRSYWAELTSSNMLELIELISHKLSSQLERSRNTAQILAAGNFLLQALILWPIALLLTAVISRVCAPGYSLVPRLSCLFLALFFPGEPVLHGISMLIGQEYATHGLILFRVTSLASLYLMCRQTESFANCVFATNSTLKARISKWLRVEVMQLLSLSPLIFVFCLAYGIAHLPIAAPISDLLLLLAFAVSIWLAYASGLHLPTLPPAPSIRITDALNLIIALVWLAPVLLGASMLTQMQITAITIEEFWWLLSLVVTGCCGVLLGLMSPPPGWIRWLIIFVLMTGLLPSLAIETNHWLAGLPAPESLDPLLIGLFQLGIVAWITHLARESFSHKQRYAVAMVRNGGLWLWLLLLQRPLLQACLTAILLGAYFSQKNLLLTTLGALLLCKMLAWMLGSKSVI